MEAFRIQKHISSTTIDIPEFQNYIGRKAEIIILFETSIGLNNTFVYEPEKEPEKKITVKEIMQLPPNKRESLLANQFKEAIALYDENPELILEDVDPYIDYESSTS